MPLALRQATCWVAGRLVRADSTAAPSTIPVRNPYDGREVGAAAVPTRAQTEEAVAAADEVRRPAMAMPAHVRADALAHVSARLATRAEQMAALISMESGKPLKWSRVEVSGAVSVFRLAAEEARRNVGVVQRLDSDVAGTGRLALIRRFPKGPVLGITPFNFPLNLAAHKVAPAIAAGAPVIVKPAPRTPLSALLLGELLAETGLPGGMFSVLPVPDERVAELVEDPRLPVVSFTGSGPVGATIRAAVPHKHVTLELGGNAAALVCPDWTDLDRAAARIATFAMYQAGQSCIAVQRVLAHRSVHDAFVERLVDAVRKLDTGDPMDERTDVGPMIDEDAARRVGTWVDEAVAAGATVLTGGTRDGAAYTPTVLTGVSPDARVITEEMFGPVLTVSEVDSVDDAFAAVNASRFGLQTGVFTHDVRTAFRAHRELDVGGVIIGDVPSYRADQMPYGGLKESGVGREGVRSAMADYCDERVLVLSDLEL